MTCDNRRLLHFSAQCAQPPHPFQQFTRLFFVALGCAVDSIPFFFSLFFNRKYNGVPMVELMNEFFLERVFGYGGGLLSGWRQVGYGDDHVTRIVNLFSLKRHYLCSGKSILSFSYDEMTSSTAKPHQLCKP